VDAEVGHFGDFGEGGIHLPRIFVAVLLGVYGRRGFSELEQSRLDGLAGKRIWAHGSGSSLTNNLVPGQLRKRGDGQEELQVALRVEKFENGAHLRLVVLQRSDRPHEMQLSVFREPDSSPLEYCILTATMGNMATFLGATLWTDFALNGNPVVSEVTAQTGMNNYRRIRTLPNYGRLRPSDTRWLHMRSRQWLEGQVFGLKGQKVVVVTHHAPSRSPGARP